MMRFQRMLLAATLVSCAALGSSQPTACLEDLQCREGYFCDTSVYVCQECLSCQDLKREPPLAPNLCITSVSQCGPCQKGLVKDPQSDLNCVPPSDGDGAPVATGDGHTAIWIAAGICIMALLFIVAAIFVYRYVSKGSMFKLNLDANIGSSRPIRADPSAPESPPPYSPTQHSMNDEPRPDEESFQLMKPYVPPFPDYNSQDYQKANMFNPPNYVRLSTEPRLADGYDNDENANYTPPAPAPEEDTVPSAWSAGTNYYEATPLGPVTNTSAPAAQAQRAGDEPASDFSTALAVARTTDLIQPASAALRAQTVNGNDEGSGRDEARGHQSTYDASARAPRYGPENINIRNVFNLTINPSY